MEMQMSTIVDSYIIKDRCLHRSEKVQLAKWITGKRKQPRLGHLLVLSLCARVIEGVREVTNR